jgi:hypothetical protein
MVAGGLMRNVIRFLSALGLAICALKTIAAQITTNPIPDAIMKRGLEVEIKDVVHLPDTRGALSGCRPRPFRQSRESWPLVRNDVVSFARIRARDDGDDRLGVADVEDFVRHARFDEDEVAGGVLDGLSQPLAYSCRTRPART